MSTRAARRHAKARQRKPLGFVAVMVVLLIGGGFMIFLSRGEGTAPRPEPPEGTQTFPDPDRSHVEGPVSYEVIPPPGGPHWAAWMNCGFYDEPVLTEAAVHSLEHGAVWLTWSPDVADDDVRAIRAQARKPHVLASPWPDDRHPAPLVATAWGFQLHLSSADDPRLEQFVDAFRAGPHAPEPGAACHGGIGEPLS